jgi:hypothetical protein
MAGRAVVQVNTFTLSRIAIIGRRIRDVSGQQILGFAKRNSMIIGEKRGNWDIFGKVLGGLSTGEALTSLLTATATGSAGRCFDGTQRNSVANLTVTGGLAACTRGLVAAKRVEVAR